MYIIVFNQTNKRLINGFVNRQITPEKKKNQLQLALQRRTRQKKPFSLQQQCCRFFFIILAF